MYRVKKHFAYNECVLLNTTASSFSNGVFILFMALYLLILLIETWLF